MQLEQELQNGWKEDVHAACDSSKKELLKLETWKSEMLCNHAPLDWTKFGGRNTK